jgi:hypothetical protein
VKLSEPGEVIIDYTHNSDSPKITVDGPDVLSMATPRMQSVAGFHYPSPGTPAELTEIEYLRLTQEELAQKLADLHTAVQMIAQELRDMRQHPIVRPK